jgi:hypothetical protein
VEFMPKGQIINTASYCATLKRLWRAIQNRQHTYAACWLPGTSPPPPVLPAVRTWLQVILTFSHTWSGWHVHA